MELKFAYLGRSQLVGDRGLQTLRFVPNLTRDAVAFDAPLRSPLRFREAISALHDVVINDLRFKPRDKTAYETWKENERQRVATIRREAYKHAKAEILAKRGEAVSPTLERDYERCRSRYWRARQEYSSYLLKHDWNLWRKLMPCDPVVTVSSDVVFFECFSADESSYGCLTVDRDGGFGSSANLQFGTTNVDYSWDLYHHFQGLRSYRETRFRVDPQGFEVATAGNQDYREEKIDLPAGWLRGFMQIQVAMGLPMRRVRLSREAVYNILAWLKRNKAKKSPRAMRFDLLPQSPPRVVLEPWEQVIDSQGTRYDGPAGEPIRIWGTRRLLTVARLLPLAEAFDVYLLGTGMPSFWVARMGEMRMTLGLSGWTTNDWTRSSALDLLLPSGSSSPGLITRCAEFVRNRQSATFAEIQSHLLTNAANCALSLNQLARSGQLICDLAAGVYRWRQVMPRVLGEADVGPANEELAASGELVSSKKVAIESQQSTGTGLRLFAGKVDGKPVELLLDADGMIKRGKCVCGHHQKAGLRMGPCRHLLALRQWATRDETEKGATATDWFDRLRRWSNN